MSIILTGSSDFEVGFDIPNFLCYINGMNLLKPNLYKFFNEIEILISWCMHVST